VSHIRNFHLAILRYRSRLKWDYSILFKPHIDHILNEVFLFKDDFLNIL